MHLEVKIEGQKPVIYILTKPEIHIGSADTSDVRIQLFGISRKHIKLFNSESGCQITDMGSTNGTYIHEEKLVPGRRYDFTLSETIRLGDKVLLTNMDKKQVFAATNIASIKDPALPDSQQTSIKHEKTKVISLQELEKAKKAQLLKKKTAIHEKQKIENARKRKERDSLKRVGVSIFIVAVIAGISQYAWQRNQLKYKFKAMKKEGIDRVAINQGETETISKTEAFSYETIKTLSSLKCNSDDEIEICKKIAFLNILPNGLKIEGPSYIFTVEETRWVRQAGEFIQNFSTLKDDPNLEAEKWDAILKVAFLNVIKEELLSVAGELADKNIYVVFVSDLQDMQTITKVFAFKGASAKIFIKEYYSLLKQAKKKNNKFVVPESNLYLAY